MLDFSRFKLIFVLTICFLSIIFIIPNFYGKSEVTALPSFFPKKQFNLGLDLQGGSHLLLEVDVNSVIKEKSSDLVDEIRKSLRKEKIKYTNLGSRGKGATVTIKNEENYVQSISLLRKEIDRGVQVKKGENQKIELIFTDEFLTETNCRTIN